MKNKLFIKTLSLLLAVLMVFPLLPATASAGGESVTVDIIAAEYDSGAGSRNILYPAGEQKTPVTVSTKELDSEKTDAYTLNITRTAADAAILELLASISGSYKNTSGDWAAMDMAAYGMAGDVAGADIVNNARGVYASGSTTDIARVIITLTALGVDASNVYGGSESVYLDFIAKLGGNAPSLITEAIFGLLALDSGEYDDTGLTLTRESCIDFLLNKKLTPAAGQSAWAITGSSPDVDTTAIAAAALAPYYGGSTNVKEAIDGALSYLSAQQNTSGHYGNSNSTAMVTVALVSLGRNPDAKTGDFAKSEKSLIDGLLAFRTDSNQFGYDSNKAGNAMSTEQGFRALVAYRGYLYSGNGAYNVYHFGAQTGDGTALTGETDTSVTPTDPSAPKNIAVRVENLYNGTTLIPETTVTLSGTHLDALKAALTANGKNPDTDLTQSYGYLSAVLGVSGGTTTGWMYAINGEIPITMLSETQIAEGDSLVLFYIDWYDSFFFTMFDRTAASSKTDEPVTLTLTGIDPWGAMGSGGTYAPISGATVYASDASGNPVGTSVVTGADGKATFSFSSAGRYTISAKRQGAVNATDLVPPLCAVTVTSSGAPTSPDPDKTITVYFTLQGLSGSGGAETWISRKTVTDIADGATVADVIIKALEGTGYTQTGAQSGYVKSITTPGGLTLSEMNNGMADSGWLYKVNSQLFTMGIDSYSVKNGDHILLYFTKDYTQDPDAGNISGSATPEADEKTADGADMSGDGTFVNPYTDVRESDWFYATVMYAAKNGLMTGTAADKFSPNSPMTRAMLVTVLYRCEGEPAVTASNPFTDAADGQWYTNAILWAYENNIAAGYGNGLFGMNDNITREQLVAVLRNYAVNKGLDASKTADLSAYTDTDEISSWALDSMKWANAEGLMQGRSTTALAPNGTATRAEAALILMRFIENAAQ